MLQKHGKLREDIGDLTQAYEEAFEMLDVDESGVLELYELKRLCKFLFNSLVA
jgi:Ca2+-binding EF-hand superfamily protein